MRATIRFDKTGVTKPKYIVVVSREPVSADPLVFFITTSQLDIYERNKMFRENAIILEAKSLEFFPKRTAINCRELYEFSREVIEDLVACREAEIIGDLPDYILGRIDQIVRNSILITAADKAKILPES